MSRKLISNSILFSCFGIMQFVVISVVTMFMYHGGDRFQPEMVGYNFFGSFLSDLGRFYGFSGASTIDTAIVYGSALALMGIGTIVFFLAHRHLVFNASKWMKTGATFFGVVAGLGYVGVALTPWDLVPLEHLVFVFVCFISFMIACIFMYLIIKNEEDYPIVYGRIFLYFGIFVCIYVLFLIFGPDSSFPFGRIIQSTGQKILVYSQAALMIVCCLGAYKRTRYE